MGSNNFLNPLESVIHGILKVVEPNPEDWKIRFQVIEELRSVVESVESLRGATVEEYGSFASNLFSKWGDLDISIQLANGLYISDAGKRRKVALLGDLQKALRLRGVWRKLQLISHARVPILKFESRLSSISCDISIDNLAGRMKSKFFLWIDKIDERFRMMVLLVKEWAKSHGINDPKNGSFNSFSLTLLVIFHFQTCAPSILPPLRDIYHGNMIDDLKGVRTDAEQHIAQVCTGNISRFRSRRSMPANRCSLAELFLSFLAKFAQLDMKAGKLGICPYTGEWVELERNKRWMPKTYALFIEDPFEQPENSARTVSNKNLGRISEVFVMTHRRLVSSSQDRLDLLGPRSQLSQFVTRPLVTIPSYGTAPFTQQMQRASRHTPEQTQRPNHTMGMAHHGNGHSSIVRPWWDIQAAVVQHPISIHTTNWRARPEDGIGSSNNMCPQPNASSHHPQVHRPQYKPLQHAWKPRLGRDETS
ncbi:hypothetical protein MLD38_002642 [Melastoma candidum]|uniref:Uncharacterized protein n=1 Tax=Melastoma candidum TaxID=119954 RepID=A0ACB9RZR1_9MYRT|nr:hypothetical protein MLD38_002642 [Melastoma candidum]